MTSTVHLADADTLADLATYLGRARRADPDGAARLVGHGDVLAVYVSPVHGGGGPVVLGLRTLRLGTPVTLDVTVPLAAASERLAERSGDGLRSGAALALPPERVAAAGWAGVSAPRQGWRPVGSVDGAALAERASAGIAEVATGAPAGSGAAAVAALRARVWGRPLAESVPDLPAGVAYAAMTLGFVDPMGQAAVFTSGPWWRLTTSAGHVLARRPALF